MFVFVYSRYIIQLYSAYVLTFFFSLSIFGSRNKFKTLPYFEFESDLLADTSKIG